MKIRFHSHTYYPLRSPEGRRLCAIMLVVSLIPVLMGLVAVVRFETMRDELTQVDAVIDEITRTDQGGDSIHHVYVTYEYAGRMYEHVALNWWSSSMYTGQHISIYIPSDEPTTPLDRNFGYLMLAVGGLILLISGGIYLYAHTPDKKAPKEEVRPC